MSDDTVMVQPVRTFLRGRDLVHPESEPFAVSRLHAQELRDNGLVVHVEGMPVPAAPVSPEPSEPAAPAVEEPEPPHLPYVPVAPRRRGRPPAKRG